VCRNPTFISYWLISAIAFACHFSFIVMSPLLFLEQLHLSSYTFSLILLVYGAAYVGGGVLAHGLSKRISANRQIIAGLLLIVLAGGLMGLLHRHAGLTVFNVLLPMMVCTMGITLARPIATSRAMDVFPDLAGTASSAGSALIFICGGVVSAWVNLSPASLPVTLATTFMALGLIALGLILATCRRLRKQRPA
jgi:DHA1 family bicyclomycin/chloramphenicol resistance-like MFS transporter